MSSTGTSLVAGLAVAALGAIPALWVLTAPSEEPVTAAPTTSEPAVTTTAPPPATAPAPEVAGLPSAIGAVLGDAGTAEIVPAETFAGALPDHVVRVLIEHGAVLTVAEDPIEERP
jgi:hypothetical protein